MFNDLTHLGESERVEGALLVDGLVVAASNLFDFYCCNDKTSYPLKTLDKLTPRSCAT